MCNRFEQQTGPIVLAIEKLMEVFEDALHRSDPTEDCWPNAEVLCIHQRDGKWGMGTALWGFDRFAPGAAKPMPVFNTRIESLKGNPFWRGVQPCWLPATAWLECTETKTAKRPATWYRMALPSGDPFLLQGVCSGPNGGALRCSMIMQPAAPALAQVHDRMPFPFALGDFAAVCPEPIVERIVAAKV